LSGKRRNEKRGEKLKRIKIVCHCCDGVGRVEETTYPKREKVMVLCPECNGKKWVWTEI